MKNMKEPKFATLLLESNQTYPIYKIHYSTKLVTLIEKPWVYNTVAISDVVFDLEEMSRQERADFLEKI